MGVSVLKSLDELHVSRPFSSASRQAYLVVQVLDQSNDTSGNLDLLRLSILDLWLSLGHVVVLLNEVGDDVIRLGQKERDELVQFLSTRHPRVLRHRRQVLRVVQSSRDKREVDTDLLVSRRGDFEQFLQDTDGLGSVGVFATSLLEDFSESSEDTVGSEVERLSAFTNRGEVGILGLLLFGRGGLLWRFGRRGRSVRNVVSLGVGLGVLYVSSPRDDSTVDDRTHLVVSRNDRFKLLDLLLQGLLHNVQRLALRRSHLLSGRLLRSDRL